MRVLLTADPELPVPPGQYGGIERIVETLVNGLLARGHDVTLCARNDSTVPCKLVGWPGSKSQNKLDTLKNAYVLSKLVAQNRFDIVHSFSRLAYLTAILPLRLPKVMSYQREPTVSQIKKAKALVRDGSLHFTGCSNYITNKIKPFAEASTVYNCAPFERYELEAIIDKDAPLVFLGRIEEVKGTHEAILIAQQSNKHLVIAGNVPSGKEAYFDAMIKPHLNDKIRYVGPVDDKQKNKILGNAAAFLMPIQWNEPFGIVMAEAMACGTPVIGIGKGAIPEVVEHGITGFVCNNVEEMTMAVSQVGKISRRQVRENAQQKFSGHIVVENYITLYQKLMANRKGKW